MPDFLGAQSTASSRSRPEGERVPSTAAWERVLDRLRLRLKGKPSRWAVFGRAGIYEGKMFWMRRQPDLRMSVIVKLSKALRVKPEKFLELVLEESKKDG